MLLSLVFIAFLPAAPQQCGGPKLEQMTRDSEVVLVGEVKDVETPAMLQSWAGLVVFKQHVRYEVKAVLKGKMPRSEVWVGYPIYYNSPLADKDLPRLSPEIFKTNSVHVVFIKLDKKAAAADSKQPETPSYVTVDVNCGAIIDTPDVETKIRTLTSTTPSSR